MRVNTIEEADLHYAAGFLDGEGCFALGAGWKITVACATTHRPTIEWLHKTFGGSLTLNLRPRKSHHRNTHRWAVVSRDAAKVCSILAPYLREKAEQAMLLLAVQQTMGKKKGRYIDPDVLEERKRYAAMLKGLKHVAS